MDLSLNLKTRRFIESQVRSGRYATAEDVVQAGMEALRQQQLFGDFEPGELNDLIAEGERSIREEGTIPAEQVFAELRQRASRRGKRP